MSSSSIAEVTSPFADHHDADVALRTCDGKCFFVYKAVLSLASPVFRDMFSLVQDVGPQSFSGLPVVDIPEDSCVVDCLLRICYPTSDPDLTNAETINSCLAVAHKYEMKYCTEVLAKQLCNFSWAYSRGNPYQTFAIACRWDLEQVATSAVSNIVYLVGAGDPDSISSMFSHPGVIAKKIYNADMSDIPAGPFYRLLQSAYARHTVYVPVMRICSAFFRSDAVVAEPYKVISFEPSRERSESPDIVIRSCDGVNFQAHRHILSSTSGILNQVSGSQEPDTVTAEHPLLTVDVAIDSTILSPILQICYQDEPFDATCLLFAEIGPKQAEAVYLSALRHHVPRAREFMAFYLESALPDNPLRVYLIAARLDLEEVAQAAAVYLARRNIAYSYHPELENTEARYFYSLLQFSLEYRDAFLKLIGNSKQEKAARDKWSTVCEVLGADAEDSVKSGPDAALAFVRGGMRMTARFRKAGAASRPRKKTTKRKSNRVRAQAAKNSAKAGDKASLALAKVCYFFCYTALFHLYAPIDRFSSIWNPTHRELFYFVGITVVRIPPDTTSRSHDV